MKLMICHDCSDFVVPASLPNVKFCRCARHAVWWEDAQAGTIRVYDKLSGAACWLLGIHNGLITYPQKSSADLIRQIIDATPDSYLFKRQQSLIVKFRPGETSDSAYAPLPH